MNKAQINKALKDGVEVAVYCDGDNGRSSYGGKPNDLFERGDAGYKRVVRCKLVATEQHAVVAQRLRGHTLSSKAEHVRVLPLDPVPAFGPNWPDRFHTPGVKPPHPDFGKVEGAVYDTETPDFLTTNRMIVGLWPEFERQVAAHEQRQVSEQAAREAREAEKRAGLDAAQMVAAKLDGFGFPVSVEINRPGAVVVSAEVAERIAATISAACDVMNALPKEGNPLPLSEAVVKFGLSLIEPEPGEAA